MKKLYQTSFNQKKTWLIKKKIKQKFEHITENNDFFLQSDSPNIKTNEVLYFLASVDKAGLVFSNLTGRFPIQSSCGNNYVLIAYHGDANAILQPTLKSRHALSIVNAWESINKNSSQQAYNHQHTSWTMNAPMIRNRHLKNKMCHGNWYLRTIIVPTELNDLFKHLKLTSKHVLQQ